MSEDSNAGVDVADVAQETGSEPYSAEEGLVAISGQAVGVG